MFLLFHFNEVKQLGTHPSITQSKQTSLQRSLPSFNISHTYPLKAQSSSTEIASSSFVTHARKSMRINKYASDARTYCHCFIGSVLASRLTIRFPHAKCRTGVNDVLIVMRPSSHAGERSAGLSALVAAIATAASAYPLREGRCITARCNSATMALVLSG